MEKQLSILAVDDEEDFLDGLVQLLERMNYSVITASDGKEAIKQYEKEKPDFVLMDVNMPNVDGYDAFFTIRKQYPNAKVILMSGYGQTGRYREAKSKCLIYCIPKPFSISFLDELLQQNIKNPSCGFEKQ